MIKNPKATTTRREKMSLLRRIELYLKQSGTAPARFGRDAIGDPNLMRDLRNGRELRARTAERLVAFLETREVRDAARTMPE